MALSQAAYSNQIDQMNTNDCPSIIEHAQLSLQMTPHSTNFVPRTATFVATGISTGGKGALSIFELSNGEVKTTFESSSVRPHGIKCSTMGASSVANHLAVGDFGGQLTIVDIERGGQEVYSSQAGGGQIINAIDGVGGAGSQYGAPELVTAGKDGLVRVFDPRVSDAVATLSPAEESTSRDCWTVAFGDSYNEQERCVCAGYDNGDVRLFDLKMGGKIRWETNCSNGITSVQFDRPDIEMNKLVVTTLESKFHAYDMRTHHPLEGFSHLTEKAHRSTVWLAKHLPQNRDIFATCGGNGGLNIYKYHNPISRTGKHAKDGAPIGVMGNVELLNSRIISTQPIVSFDWSPDKDGLAVMAALDQTLRVQLITKLDKY